MHHYQHHIGDFNNATRHLTRIEKSIYRDLVELYYETEMPLQCDRIALARKIMARGDLELAAMDTVLEEFFTLEGDFYHHTRCDSELAKIYEKSDKARLSAEKRWAKHAKKKGKNENATRTHSDGNANGMLPVTRNPLITTTTTRPTISEISDYVATRDIKIDPQRFLDYYEANGWRVGKNPMKNWQAAVRTWEKRGEQDKPTPPKPQGSKTRDTTLRQDLTDTSWAN